MINKILLAVMLMLPLGVAMTALAAVNPTTNAPTVITSTDATLNGTNGDSDAVGHSFWASLNTFSTASPTIPAGVYSTPDLGAISAGTPFNGLLSSTGIPVTPGTTYYFAAWSNVGSTWYPGNVLNFTTAPAAFDITVTAENFNTNKGTDYWGATTGYRLDGADVVAKVTSVSVSLYDASDNLLVTNTTKSAAKAVQNQGTTHQYSSAFIVMPGTYSTSSTWNFGAWTPNINVVPAKMVVTVTDVNGDTYTAQNTAFQATEPSHPTWESLFTGTLNAEDFGVVSYDTGLGMLSGYTAGFGLTDATFDGATSVVVKLYSGLSESDLMQTNTAILATFNTDITGTQFSSPFDVSGTFNYATDGYWTNVRESQYGQSVPATRVVATVTLENGKVVTAENTLPTGDPETIYPVDPSPTVTVTIEKFVQGVMATAVTANNADFPMSSTWDAENIGTGTALYLLSETNTTPYKAVTGEMTEGADYETNELLNGDVVGAQCADGKPFALQGYTVGNTRAEALVATSSMAMPSFTNLQHDKFVIVWNRDCALPEVQIGGDGISGDGVLEVTSIEMIDTNATANGSFASGWEYVFHITAPMSEENLAMKFSNWLKTGGGGTIPVANNMRISSLQADNGGATILLTAANVYSTPYLHMTGDLDLITIGRQVEITVEVAVPNGTPNGAYTTSYGVQSNP